MEYNNRKLSINVETKDPTFHLSKIFLINRTSDSVHRLSSSDDTYNIPHIYAEKGDRK